MVMACQRLAEAISGPVVCDVADLYEESGQPRI